MLTVTAPRFLLHAQYQGWQLLWDPAEGTITSPFRFPVCSLFQREDLSRIYHVCDLYIVQDTVHLGPEMTRLWQYKVLCRGIPWTSIMLSKWAPPVDHGGRRPGARPGPAAHGQMFWGADSELFSYGLTWTPGAYS